MEVFNKKETLIRTISFMAFFVAINVMCSFLTTVLPLLSVVMIIFLPLTSAMVEVMCKDRWFPIYAFSTIGLSIVVSLQSIDFTLFYIIPSIFTGYIFGLFSKRNLPGMFSIFVASIIQMVLSIASIYILEVATGIDIFDIIAKILRISDRFWFNLLILVGFFFVGLVQTFLSYIVVKNELSKFGNNPSEINNNSLVPEIATLVSLAVSTLFSFFYLSVSILFYAFAIYFFIFVIIEHVKAKQKMSLIIDGIILLLAIFFYAGLNNLISNDFHILLLFFAPLLISSYSIFHYFLKKSQ